MSHAVAARCHICGDVHRVSALLCPGCDPTITGHLELGTCRRLAQDQHEFAESVIRCKRRITRVEAECGLS
jgi:hypothetical protein